MPFLRPVAAIVVGLMLYGALPAARAGGTNAFDDPKRGFSIRVPDSFKQTPPKPTGDPKYQAAQFYDDMPKYQSSGATNPEFNITWWVTPKSVTTPGSGTSPEGGGGPESNAPPSREDMEDMFGPKSQDELLDRLIENNTRLFGSKEPPMAERWASAKTAKTDKQKIEFRYLDINSGKSKKKDDEGPLWYLFAAQLTIERPTESIVMGFWGNCTIPISKDLAPAFLKIVKSLEVRDVSGSTTTREEAPTDPAKYVEWLKRTKVVPGWKSMDSPKKQYLLIYDESVNEKLVRTIAEQVESLRAQVYETVFPPDRPITAISVIRVCKDSEQYMAYGAPGGTAGYWSPWDKELVFYEDSRNKKDSLRVLYHEAFHQYIYYSVGAFSPHSWFNEGDGDYFYGFNLKNGRWELGKSLDRVGTAADLKRTGRAPPLKEWLHWTQEEYYGHNKAGLSGPDNYALGWDFIYFLRTTKKKEYQGILERYFDTLKGLVTKAREEREKARAKMKADGMDPGPEEDEDIANRMHENEWLEQTLDAAFKGVDLDQLYKDWMANTP